MLSFYRSLLALRRGHEVWGTGVSKLISVDDRGILAFTRENAKEKFLVVVNLAVEEREGTLDGITPTNAKLVLGQASLKSNRVKLAAKGHAVFAF